MNTPQTLSTRELLAEYTALVNRHGVDSVEAAEWIEQHKQNTEFVQLAETARILKMALTAPSNEESKYGCDSPSNH